MRKVIGIIKEHVMLSAFILLLVYGVSLFCFGLMNGAYWTEYTKVYSLLGITESVDNYKISFYASAEQDFWFFMLVGLFMSLINNREPKNDNLSTKVNHFFPTVDPSSAHMRHLEKEINKQSCISPLLIKDITIAEIDNDLIETINQTITDVKNIHHNHAINENYGAFAIEPDERVTEEKKAWGRINGFTIDTATEGCKAVAQNQPLTGSSFFVKYNINLLANESGKVTCNFSMWEDFDEKTELTTNMFTREYRLKICNQSKSKIKVVISKDSNDESEIYLESTQSMAQPIIYTDMVPDENVITINYVKCD